MDNYLPMGTAYINEEQFQSGARMDLPYATITVDEDENVTITTLKGSITVHLSELPTDDYDCVILTDSMIELQINEELACVDAMLQNQREDAILRGDFDD